MFSFIKTGQSRLPGAGAAGKEAFSLVEVVLALGIVSFAGLALLGLFSVGLSTNRESIEELEATHVAQSIFAFRRASPLSTNQAGFPLPALDKTNSVTESSPVYLTDEGHLTGNAAAAKFGMIYRVTPDPNSYGGTKVYLCLYWPANVPASKAQGRFETYSIFTHP